MELKAGSVIEAKKPGGRRKSATVQEDVRRGENTHVKVKFNGDAQIYSLPWKDINAQHLFPVTNVKEATEGIDPVVVVDEESPHTTPKSSAPSRTFAPAATSRRNGVDRSDNGIQGLQTSPLRNANLAPSRKDLRIPHFQQTTARVTPASAFSFTARFGQDPAISPDGRSRGERKDVSAVPDIGLADSPSRKQKESVLEFTPRRPPSSVLPEANTHPFSSKNPRTFYFNPESSSQFPSPPKRQRRSYSLLGTNASAAKFGSLRTKEGISPTQTGLTHGLTHGTDDISISRYQEKYETSPYRIPRKPQYQQNFKRGPSPPYESPPPPPPQRNMFMSHGNQHLSAKDASFDFFGRPWGMDSSKIGNRVLDPDTEMEDRIISIKHQPVSPIAKSFKGSGRFPWEDAADFKLPESESKALEICDKLIQESKGGGASDHTSDVDEILEVKPELEELQYASTTKRRKSKPKKWGLRSLPHVNVCAPSELKCVRGADLADDVVSGHTAFRICGCKCGNPLGTGRALQCGVCGLWHHANCVQIYNATQAGRETTEASKLFMCEKCTEKVITEESILAGLQGNGVSAETSKEPESFIFAQTSITPGGRVETVGMHDAWGWKEPPKNRDWVGGVAQKPRMPLTESAIQSRAENVELLRSGVRPPSIGYEERETIDSQFNKMIL